MAALFSRAAQAQAPDQWTAGNRMAIDAFPPGLVRGLRRMLTQATYQERFPARLALTSALSGEGVTYLAMAVATTLASDQRARVCVAELNWSRPGQLRQLRDPLPQPQRRLPWRKPAPPIDSAHIPESAGAAGVLKGTATLREALLPSILPNLVFLPAGELAEHERPAMARSAALNELIGRLGQYFDHVLLDVPALLATSDAIALASLADACCLVVRHGVTSVSDARQALDEIRHLPIQGVLLNKVRFHTPAALQSLIPHEELL